MHLNRFFSLFLFCVTFFPASWYNLKYALATLYFFMANTFATKLPHKFLALRNFLHAPAETSSFSTLNEINLTGIASFSMSISSSIMPFGALNKNWRVVLIFRFNCAGPITWWYRKCWLWNLFYSNWFLKQLPCVYLMDKHQEDCQV